MKKGRSLNIASMLILMSLFLCMCDFDVRDNPNDPQSSDYTVDTRAELSNLYISDGLLTPDFDPDIITYSTTVPYSVSSVTLTPVAEGYGTTIYINSSAAASGYESAPIDLDEGENILTVEVTAEDQVTDKTYTITVNRADAASSNANLLGLGLSSGALTPSFNKDTLSYTVTIENTVTSLTVTPTAENGGVEIKVNGVAVISENPSPAITMNVGINPVTVVVTALDGITKKTYSLSVTRLSTAFLSDLTVSSGSLTPAFDSGIYNYILSVRSAVSSVTLTPFTDAGNTITVNGSAVSSGNPSSPMAIGTGSDNTVTIVVTAPDMANETYVLIIIRPAVDLPATGQTSCYDADGIVIACSGTGHDGDLQRGMPWPGTRFTDNADNTVTDNLTGLMWEKKPGGGNDGTGTAGTVTWTGALSYANGLTLGSHNDWRLPNVNELESLLHYGKDNSATWLTTEECFTAVQGGSSDSYWTSTTCVYSSYRNRALTVGFYYSKLTYSDKSLSLYAWAVRDSGSSGTISLPKTGQTVCYDADGGSISCSGTGQDGDIQKGTAWPATRFSAYGADMIIDNLTGLVWEKTLSSSQDTWTSALTYCNSLSMGVVSDWRLPNIREIRSMVNYGQEDSSTWLATQGFSGVSMFHYSSTTCQYNLDYAWLMRMNYGIVSNGGKSETGGYNRWAVTAGQ